MMRHTVCENVPESNFTTVKMSYAVYILVQFWDTWRPTRRVPMRPSQQRLSACNTVHRIKTHCVGAAREEAVYHMHCVLDAFIRNSGSTIYSIIFYLFVSLFTSLCAHIILFPFSLSSTRTIPPSPC